MAQILTQGDGSRSGGTIVMVVVGVVAVGLVVAALGGLVFGTQVTSEEFEGPASPIEVEGPPADGSHGIVLGASREKDGFNLFGWDIVDSEYRAHVQFIPPAGCNPPETGEFVAEGACAGAPASGRISGGGTTADGSRLVGVAVRINEACYEALTFGERWPSTHPECAD